MYKFQNVLLLHIFGYILHSEILVYILSGPALFIQTSQLVWDHRI